ncbi:MAG: HAMP domain-containing protein [Bacteroidetes bacterium]|nr:HAMP domain-containing protein [Bacteroidota bacterium]
MKISFKKRMALINTLAVALTTALVFLVIYSVVFLSSYRHLDSDILQEKEEIINNLEWKEDSIIINQMPEWEEAEHSRVEVNPTFIQIVDREGRMIFRSANLKANHFLFDPGKDKGYFFNYRVEGQRLRLGQFPVHNDSGKIIGQLTIGVSQQESWYVLHNLLITLCIAFPLLLLALYGVTYMAASRSIAPVNQLIRAASGMSDSDISTRLPLPGNEDEIFQLAKTINELLERIEASVQQQKQFTADASHEIRTPLTAISGILEVLLRKKREPEQYEEKIKEVLAHTGRLNQLLDQLLQLARLETVTVKKEKISLEKLTREILLKWDRQIKEKGLHLSSAVDASVRVVADPFFLAILLDNLFSNAIKYAAPGGYIRYGWDSLEHTFSITNDGLSIAPDQVPVIFDRFYRAESSRNAKLPGSGLGLAIVKKLAGLMLISVSVRALPGNTTFILRFPA